MVPIKNSHGKKEKAVVNSQQNSKRSASKLFTQSNFQMAERKIQAAHSKPKPMTTKDQRRSRTKSNQSKSSSSGSKWHHLGAKESRESDNISPQFTESSSTVSRISLDHDQASMENNASSRSRHSTSSDLDSSIHVPSNLSESRGSGDYLDNFPYAPPNRKPIPRHIVSSRWSIKPK